MSNPQSRIPHLARAIFEKRALQKNATAHTQKCLLPPSPLAHAPIRAFTTQKYLNAGNTTLSKPGVRRAARGGATTTAAAAGVAPATRKSAIPPLPPKSTTSPLPPPPPPPRFPSSSSSSKETPHNNNNKKRLTHMTKVLTIFSFILGTYTTFIYMSWTTQIKTHALSHPDLLPNSDVSDRWKQLGRDYDDEVEFSEKYWFMNLKGKRKEMVRRAYGTCLEVSCGTGRNFEYFDLRPMRNNNTIEVLGGGGKRKGKRSVVGRLVCNDQSGIMLGEAEKKVDEIVRRGLREGWGDGDGKGKVEFVVGDAGVRGVISRPVGGFDTIVQTMGLCSMVDPVGFLRTMGKLVRQPGEVSKGIDMQEGEDDGKGGKILLLEHGKSSYGWVNNILDSGASMHADHYGCWWNKDIEKIVRDSGLVVESIRRWHFGTTWEVVLRPKGDKAPE